MTRAEMCIAKMLFGYGCYELGGKYALNLEQPNLGTTPLYLLMISLSSLGVLLFMNGGLHLYRLVTVKEDLNIITKQPLHNWLIVEVKKMKLFERFRKNVRAEATSKSIIVLAVGFVLMAVLAPIGLDQIYAANTTGWETAVTTIFTLVLPIVFIIGGAMKFVEEIRN